ncbi:MAG: KilA-N domain-containing protein [Chitinophagaceae bacterium]|nr:KilA-N domain-containing protein [Chitinophagaceae bacterium]
MAKINVKETEITIFKKEEEDYISLTDIAKTRDKENPSQIISLWLRTYNTIEFIGLWEMLNNPDFKPHIYEGFKNESAKPHF